MPSIGFYFECDTPILGTTGLFKGFSKVRLVKSHFFVKSTASKAKTSPEHVFGVPGECPSEISSHLEAQKFLSKS